MLYLDTETTGLWRPHDDLVEVALVNDDGRRLVDELCRPAEPWMQRDWPGGPSLA
jgi:hypothetical protein